MPTNLVITPRTGGWYANLDGHGVFEVLNADASDGSVLIQYHAGGVEEIDLETWKEMEIKSVSKRNKWGENHEQAFMLMDNHDEFYNTDSLSLTFDPEEAQDDRDHEY